MTVELATLPDKYESLIIIGTSVRKSATVLQPYLDSLAWQELPPRTKVKYVFVDDGCERDARSLLDEFVTRHGGEGLRGAAGAVGGFSATPPTTPQRCPTGTGSVGAK